MHWPPLLEIKQNKSAPEPVANRQSAMFVHPIADFLHALVWVYRKQNKSKAIIVVCVATEKMLDNNLLHIRVIL